MANASEQETWGDDMEVEEGENNRDESGSARKKKKVNDIINVPTSNGFSPLSNLVDVNNASNSKGNTNTGKKETTTARTRTPPITVVGKKRDEVINICRNTGVKDNTFSLKLTSIGINILCNDVETFTKLRDQFKTTSQCFSYDMASEKWQKIVLKGLFRMNIDDLKKELSLHGITPEDIKLIAPTKSKYEDQAHYLLYFKKGSTTINDLRKCRSLCYLKVDWEYYTPKKFGPTQCHKCQMFGHGSRHCTLPVKCMFCAGAHETRHCLSVSNRIPIEGFTYKCANCDGDHKANDESCPKLKNFLAIQETITRKNDKRNRTRTNPEVSNVTMNFPPLPTRQPLRPFTTSQPTTGASQYFVQQQQQPAMSYSAAAAGSHNNFGTRRTTMFSGPELVTIAQEVISTLGSCNSPDDQYLAIVNLAIKFLYGGP